MTAATIAKALETRSEYAEMLRQLCEGPENNQLWRQVPWLALEADVQCAQIGRYGSAYLKLWEIHQTDRRAPKIYVDCTTGALICGVETRRRLTDQELVAIDPTLLDAAAVVAKLTAEAEGKQFCGQDDYAAHNSDRRRQEIIEQYQLTPDGV